MNAFTRGSADISFRQAANFYFEQLIKIINSSSKTATGFSIDDSFVVSCNIVSMPVGSGRSKKASGKEFWQKRSVIGFNNKDKLCLPRAIVVGRVCAERGQIREGALQEQWDNVRRDRSALQ